MDNTRMILALNCSIFLFMFGVGLITPLLPGKVLSFSGSAIQIGCLASAFACSFIIVQVPIGILADKFGYKYFIACGYLVCGLSGFMYLLADSPVMILSGRFIQGIGEAPLWALAPAILSLYYPRNKASVIGWYNGSLHIGLTSGSIFSFIVHDDLPKDLIFWIFISVCFMSALCTLIFVNEKPVLREKLAPQTGLKKQIFLHLIQDYRILCVLIGITIYGVGYGLYITIIPSFLLENVRFTQNSVGWVFIVFYISISIAQLIGGYIATTWGRFLPMIVGLLLFSLSQLFFPFFSAGATIALLSLGSFGLGLFFVGSMACLNDQVEKNSKGVISGIFYLCWGTGYFSGPLLFGYAGEQGRYIHGFIALGILGIAVAFFLLISNRDMKTKDVQ